MFSMFLSKKGETFHLLDMVAHLRFNTIAYELVQLSPLSYDIIQLLEKFFVRIMVI